jgi:uncharacterized damage-inducible protein DinB
MAARMTGALCLVATFVVHSAQAQSLTVAERQTLMRHLQQTREAFLESIAGLSDAQWTFKSGADRWSIAEVAEHIAISETSILHVVTDDVLSAPALTQRLDTVSDEALLAWLLDRTSKFQAPEMLKPTHRWATREALTKDFLAARDRTMAYVKGTNDNLRGHGGPHPIFKMLDGYQWLLLLSGHSARHTAQILEVKASAGYPSK